MVNVSKAKMQPNSLKMVYKLLYEVVAKNRSERQFSVIIGELLSPTERIMIAKRVVIFYFLIIRPQSKRQKKHQDFVSGLKRGDSVLTSGGMFGTVEGFNDKFVTLEVSDGVRVKFLRAQIAGPVSGDEK